MDEALLQATLNGWGWVGLEPREILAVNTFGNLLLSDKTGRCWRICPEELSAEVVADDQQAYRSLLVDEEFIQDWEMGRLVQIATDHLGSPTDGRCFCLKIPATLGGKYEAENFGTISVTELIVSSGDIAQQIKDLPDGAQVRFKITD